MALGMEFKQRDGVKRQRERDGAGHSPTDLLGVGEVGRLRSLSIRCRSVKKAKVRMNRCGSVLAHIFDELKICSKFEFC
ncbi:hypothetical protein JHK86_018617 [Glycine max]|nr:hypothetical protein JHK86_018617 [Glycine max]